jgi:hypothetical protein
MIESEILQPECRFEFSNFEQRDVASHLGPQIRLGLVGDEVTSLQLIFRRGVEPVARAPSGRAEVPLRPFIFSLSHFRINLFAF